MQKGKILKSSKDKTKINISFWSWKNKRIREKRREGEEEEEKKRRRKKEGEKKIKGMEKYRFLYTSMESLSMELFVWITMVLYGKIKP